MSRLVCVLLVLDAKAVLFGGHTYRVVNVQVLGQRVTAIVGDAGRAVVRLEGPGRHDDSVAGGDVVYKSVYMYV